MANTDLVTYYGQTEKIDQLVEKYGAYLEQLDRKTKLLLRTTLSQYVFMQRICTPEDYSLTEALKDGDFERFLCDAEMLNADTKLYIDSYTNSKKPKLVNITSSLQTNEHN